MSDSTSSYPTVASLWVGDRLTWLHALCLASFAHKGHEVVLFHTGDAPNDVPNGVDTCPIEMIWDFRGAGHADAPPSMLSDLFRVYLLQKTDMIWIDTDMMCIKPIPDVPYHVGFEPTGQINGAVLRLPKESETLNGLITFFEDPEWVPPWLQRRYKKQVEAAPAGQRLRLSFDLIRPSLGPRALDNVLKATGEIEHACPADVFYPVRGVMSDTFFSPLVDDDRWLSDNTLAVHLYSSLVRRYHKAHRPDDNSFIGRMAKEIGIDLSDLRQQSIGNA